MSEDYRQENPDVAAAVSPTVNAAVLPESGLGLHQEPVLVFDSPTVEEAEVARATLQAAGIHAYFANSDTNPVAGAIDAGIDSNTYANGIYVYGSDAEAARALLNTSPMTEAELTAAEEADPMTLEEAEARVKHAP